MRNPYKILIGNLEGNRSFGRTRRRREGTDKMDLKEMRCVSVEWAHLAQARVL
jgi:hypothetical protein